MSRPFLVSNDSEIKTINWMLESFPEWLKQKCKEKAVSERKTLKAFVIEKLQKACDGKLKT
jgi:hypothetical protein